MTEKKKNFLSGTAGTVRAVGKKLTEDHVSLYAAEASFFMMISSVPFVMLLLSLMKYLIPIGLDEILINVTGFLPKQVSDFAADVLTEVYDRANIPVMSLSALTLFWTASKGIRSIASGIRAVYGNGKSRYGTAVNILFSLLYTLIFFVVTVLALILIVFGTDTVDFLAGQSTALAETAEVIRALRGGVFLIVLTAIFLLAYRLFSKSGFGTGEHFGGAVFAAIGWLVFSWLYSLYIDNVADYSYVYGSLGALIVLMLWLYMGMKILLYGAELNVWLAGRR